MSLKLVPLQRRFCGQRINGQAIKEYSIPFPTNVGLGLGETYKVFDASVDVTWDESKTLLHQSLLSFSGHLWRGPFSYRAVEVRLYVNDHLVIARGWSIWEAGCVTKSAEGTNIGAYLVNGTNKFRLELVGSWELEWAGVDALVAKFEAWFTGEPPTVKPTTPQWVTYVKWGAIGVGIIAVVYLGIRAYEARKRS